MFPECSERAEGGGAGEDGRDDGNLGHVVGDVEAVGHWRNPRISGRPRKGESPQWSVL